MVCLKYLVETVLKTSATLTKTERKWHNSSTVTRYVMRHQAIKTSYIRPTPRWDNKPTNGQDGCTIKMVILTHKTQSQFAFHTGLNRQLTRTIPEKRHIKITSLDVPRQHGMWHAQQTERDRRPKSQTHQALHASAPRRLRRLLKGHGKIHNRSAYRSRCSKIWIVVIRVHHTTDRLNRNCHTARVSYCLSFHTHR